MAEQIITLVFTDVAGSSAAKRDTALGSNASMRDKAYLEAIQSKHLRLVRSAVAEHRGHEIMTIGDSFFLTFEEPLDALRCCAAMQQRLIDQPIDTLHGPLRLRIGLHTGVPEYFEGSWHGTDVDIAARCQSVASPRQILVTHATRQLLGDPIGIKFRPLGSFALKGVGNVKLWDADYDYHGLRTAVIRSNEQKRRTTIAAALATALVLVPLLALGGWHWWAGQAEQRRANAKMYVGKPNAIILASFENKTGDPVFDSLLTQAFSIQLQQSPVLSIVSAEHLRQSIQYLGKPADAPLTPAAAREIGVREGIKAYLTGTINKLSSAYVIDVNAINTENGDSIASAQAQAPDKDHVLDALSTVATAIRKQLGESLESIHQLDTPLGQATTPSLDAFRAFALGDVEHDQGRDIPNAEGHYRQALEIDPTFAMAWVRLGAVYSNVNYTGKATDCIRKAFEFSKNVSARERFSIDGFYYTDVTGDLQKAIDTLELACRTYPLDKRFFINLGIAQDSLGQVEKALANDRKALALAPDSAISNTNIFYNLLELDRFSEAQVFGEALQKLGLKDTSDMSNFYSLHAFTGDTAGMARDLAATRGRDDENVMTTCVATTDEYFGRYAEAETAWNQAVAECALQKAYDAEAFDQLLRVSGRLNAGLPVDAMAGIHQALSLDQSRSTRESAAYVATLSHHAEKAEPLIAQLIHDYPDDTELNGVWIPVSRAQIALADHRPQAALQALQGSERFALVSPAEYLRGLAYLQLHKGPEAAQAFRIATKYRGAAVLNLLQNFGQAQLGLARALSMEGDTAGAKKAYTDLFVTWKNADPDLPQLIAAKKEYAALP